MFRDILERHGKAFAFFPREIGCANPRTIEPMVIFTVPHVPWNLKPIPIPRTHLPKLNELLKEKVSMGILERSNALYSNRWFTVLKKNGSLRFIQDLQPRQQGDNPKCQNRSERGRICRSVCGPVHLLHWRSLFRI